MINIISMLHNSKTGRYHPIAFTCAPMPGPPTDLGAERYRSRGHHTAGFTDRAEAIASAQGMIKQWPADLALDGDIEWDGEDVPATTLWFGKVDGILRPLF